MVRTCADGDDVVCVCRNREKPGWFAPLPDRPISEQGNRMPCSCRDCDDRRQSRRHICLPIVVPPPGNHGPVVPECQPMPKSGCYRTDTRLHRWRKGGLSKRTRPPCIDATSTTQTHRICRASSDINKCQSRQRRWDRRLILCVHTPGD